jgi:Recombinase
MGLRPGTPPTGYLSSKLMDRKCEALVDPQRGHVITTMFNKVAHEQWSGRKLYHWLRFELNFHTTGNKPLSLGNLYRTLSNPFYHSIFEFPRNSGNWHQGKHEALTTKETFNKVQEWLKRDNITRKNHEFAFTKLMLCGSCGSCITAEEKYKPLKNGTSAHYIYYGCGRTRDHSCKGNTYLWEEELVNQLLTILDKIDIHTLKVQVQFEEELKRHNKFQRGVLGLSKSDTKHEDIDTKTYAKYILKEGTNEEKRQLMNCFQTKLMITKGVLTVA